MPTENEGSTTETADQEQQGQQQTTTEGETPQPGESQQTPNQEPIQLPEDHPLVKALTGYKGKIATQAAELQELRAKSARVTQLETDLQARPTQEAIDTLQTRYDRLEAFAQAVGIGKALDSRSFTRDLFETDKDIAELVKEWNKANPSTTSQALGSGAASPSDSKPDMNKLLRAALK